ncbi:hypothetical protein EDD15DRAFT_2174957 [Pisolithus albus]|nr:hypothetical protein EDD15DRAFT_2174957 [Pisolithus albus]
MVSCNSQRDIHIPTASQSQNDYIREWLRHKEDLLRILLEMEAAPSPRNCTKCGKDGVYRCTDCMHQPLFCTDCCRILHEAHPFHRIQQWTGEFFEDSALHMTGFQLYLGHNGAPCPSAIPLHLRPPVNSKYLTIIDVTGVHFVRVQPCQCLDADSYHRQLFQAKLCASTFEKPSVEQRCMAQRPAPLDSP